MYIRLETIILYQESSNNIIQKYILHIIENDEKPHTHVHTHSQTLISKSVWLITSPNSYCIWRHRHTRIHPHTHIYIYTHHVSIQYTFKDAHKRYQYLPRERSRRIRIMCKKQYICILHVAFLSYLRRALCSWVILFWFLIKWSWVEFIQFRALVNPAVFLNGDVLIILSVYCCCCCHCSCWYWCCYCYCCCWFFIDIDSNIITIILIGISIIIIIISFLLPSPPLWLNVADLRY